MEWCREREGRVREDWFSLMHRIILFGLVIIDFAVRLLSCCCCCPFPKKCVRGKKNHMIIFNRVFFSFFYSSMLILSCFFFVFVFFVILYVLRFLMTVTENVFLVTSVPIESLLSGTS